jgi:hypothetical protein
VVHPPGGLCLGHSDGQLTGYVRHHGGTDVESIVLVTQAAMPFLLERGGSIADVARSPARAVTRA